MDGGIPGASPAAARRARGRGVVGGREPSPRPRPPPAIDPPPSQPVAGSVSDSELPAPPTLERKRTDGLGSAGWFWEDGEGGVVPRWPPFFLPTRLIAPGCLVEHGWHHRCLLSEGMPYEGCLFLHSSQRLLTTFSAPGCFCEQPWHLSGGRGLAAAARGAARARTSAPSARPACQSSAASSGNPRSAC